MAMRFLADEISSVKRLFDQVVDYKVKQFPSKPVGGSSNESSQGSADVKPPEPLGIVPNKVET